MKNLIWLPGFLLVSTFARAELQMKTVRPLFVGVMAEEPFDFASCQSLVTRVDKTVYIESLCKVKQDREKLYAAFKKRHSVDLTKPHCAEDNVYKRKVYSSRCAQYVK